LALSDLWTRAQLRANVRQELLDPVAKFWPDSELNTYIERWQVYLQNRFEFVWATTTATVAINSSTLTLSAVDPAMMRLDAMYWNGTRRLPPRSKEDLDVLKRGWRNDTSGSEPRVTYQDSFNTVSIWPPCGTSGTIVFEYPKHLTFGTTTLADSLPMQIPAWTKYSCKNFCVEHALLRHGPNQDLPRAQRRRKKFAKQVSEFSTMKANFFPDRAPVMRPGGSYEGEILNPVSLR
jgi:hypothetical protein